MQLVRVSVKARAEVIGDESSGFKSAQEERLSLAQILVNAMERGQNSLNGTDNDSVAVILEQDDRESNSDAVSWAQDDRESNSDAVAWEQGSDQSGSGA